MERDVDSPEWAVEQAMRHALAKETRDGDAAVDERPSAKPGTGTLVIAAVSGGADSVFLLHVLHALVARMPFTLAAITVNHRLRDEGESAGDAVFVESLCASLTPPCPCVRVDIPPGEIASLAVSRGRGIEDAARFARYEAFERAARERGASFVATGHTRNDRLETILMRVLQGSSASSLAGIAPARGLYIRPLLDLSRDEIVAYLKERGLSWREDSTNSDGRYVRNRLRNTLIPVLREAYPGWEAGLLTLAEKAALDDSAIRSIPAPSWARLGESAISIDAPWFFSLPEASRVRLVSDGLILLGVSRRLSWRLIKAFANASNARGPVCGAGLRASIREGRKDSYLLLEVDIVHNNKSGYLVYVTAPCLLSLPFGTMEISEREGKAFLDGYLGPFPFPLTVRSRAGGDEVKTSAGGTKSIKKLYNEWAVREELRAVLPVIECQGAVRAVYGKPFGYPDWIQRERGPHHGAER